MHGDSDRGTRAAAARRNSSRARIGPVQSAEPERTISPRKNDSATSLDGRSATERVAAAGPAAAPALPITPNTSSAPPTQTLRIDTTHIQPTAPQSQSRRRDAKRPLAARRPAAFSDDQDPQDPRTGSERAPSLDWHEKNKTKSRKITSETRGAAGPAKQKESLPKPKGHLDPRPSPAYACELPLSVRVGARLPRGCRAPRKMESLASPMPPSLWPVPGAPN